MITAAQPFTSDQFSRPIDLIRAEHDRQFRTSNWLIELANSRHLETLLREVEALLGFLTDDLPNI